MCFAMWIGNGAVISLTNARVNVFCAIELSYKLRYRNKCFMIGAYLCLFIEFRKQKRTGVKKCIPKRHITPKKGAASD